MKRALLIFLAATLQAADTDPDDEGVVIEEFRSTNGRAAVQCYYEKGRGRYVRVVSTKDSSKWKFLMHYQRSIEAIFSDDDEWLAVNDHRGSDASYLLLFRKRGPVDYKQVVDISPAAWKFFDRRNGFKAPNPYHHRYVTAIRWVKGDHPTILVRMNGHDDKNGTSDWMCLYDVARKTFSTDFAAHNRKNTNLPP